MQTENEREKERKENMKKRRHDIENIKITYTQKSYAISIYVI